MTPASGAPTNDECNSVKVYSFDPAGHLGVFTARPMTGCSYAALDRAPRDLKRRPRVGRDQLNLISSLVLRATFLFGMITVAIASEKLDRLVNAAASFRRRSSNNSKCSKAIHHRRSLPKRQLIARRRNGFTGGRAGIDEHRDRQRSAARPEVNKFAAAFAVADEDQEMAADEQTAALLKQLRLIQTSKRQRWNSTKRNRSRVSS
jgi:hypothetical protein